MTTAQVFAIAGPAMIANLTTPLIGIVSTTAIGIWSAPLVLINYVVLGWLIGLAHARLALGLQIAINITNAAATVLLVLVLDLGIAGATCAISWSVRSRSSFRRGSRCDPWAMPDCRALLVHYAARGGLQALRYPALLRASFGKA